MRECMETDCTLPCTCDDDVSMVHAWAFSMHAPISCTCMFNSYFSVASSVIETYSCIESLWAGTGCRHELVTVMALSWKADSSIGGYNMYINIGNTVWKKLTLEPTREAAVGVQTWVLPAWAGAVEGTGRHKHELGKTLEGECPWCLALKGGQNLEIWRLGQAGISIWDFHPL